MKHLCRKHVHTDGHDAVTYDSNVGTKHATRTELHKRLTDCCDTVMHPAAFDHQLKPRSGNIDGRLGWYCRTNDRAKPLSPMNVANCEL